MKRHKLLYPFSLIYQLVVGLRNFLFDYSILRSTEFSTPVISVGNITVGGTGKTPHVLYLVDFLKEKYQLATLSRGYKRKSKGFIKASLSSTSLEIGDEPKLIKQTNPNISVSVDENRVAGVRNLLKTDENLEIILLDDAYQHRWIKPSISILLIDYNRPLQEDSYLPYGNLRESKAQARRATILLITKAPKDLKPMEQRVILTNLNLFPYQNLFFTYMEYQNLKNVFFSDKEIGIELIDKTHEIILITGIANTDSIIEYLSKTKAKINHLKFEDHHLFTEKDISNIIEKFNQITSKNKFIITTEKDAMRLNEFDLFTDEIQKNCFFLPIKVKFINNQEKQFNELLINHINRNSKLKEILTKYEH